MAALQDCGWKQTKTAARSWGWAQRREERPGGLGGHLPPRCFVAPPRDPSAPPPRVWPAGKGGGRSGSKAASQPGLAQLRPAALLCADLHKFVKSWFAHSSPPWLSLTRWRKCPSTSTSKGFYPILKVCGLNVSPVKAQWDRVRGGFDLWRPHNPIFALWNLLEL